MATFKRPAVSLERLSEALRESMEARYGPLLGRGELASALGHVSAASLRQARRRGQTTVTLFTLPRRRGYFALTRDVADWLARTRYEAETDRNPEFEEETPET